MIKGINHVYDRFSLLEECGIEWNRVDCPYPFDEDGKISELYKMYKQRCEECKAHGLKIMSLTPNPMRYIRDAGIDIRKPDGYQRIAEVTAFLANDLKGLVDGWQVGNELNVYFFRAPYDFDEAIRFAEAGMEGIRSVDKEILCGYNFSEYDETSIYMMKKLLHRPELYNYIGYDGYCGTWIKGGPDDFITAIDEIYALTQKPVLMQEFGFASTGDVIEEGELDRAMSRFGFRDFDEAVANCELFLERLPEELSAHIKSAPSKDWEANLRHLEPHILKKWVGGSAEYPHTLEGQAKFYRDLLPMLLQSPHLIGFFIFSFRDAGRCFFCKEEDCPCETAWGLLDRNGEKKPSFYAVKEALCGAGE